MSKHPYIDYGLNYSDLDFRFKPNLLYSKQPFDSKEIENFLNGIALVKEYNPFFKETNPDAAIVAYASANLRSNASESKDFSLVGIDFEFIRLSNTLIDYLDEKKIKNVVPITLDVITDQILFHSIIRTGKYDWLKKISHFSFQHSTQENLSEYSLISFLYILNHEISHIHGLKVLDFHKELKTIFLEEGAFHVNYSANNHLNYPFLFRRIIGEYGLNHYIPFSFADIVESDESVLNEIVCDQEALACTMAAIINMNIPIEYLIVSIFSVETCQALVEFSEQFLELFETNRGNISENVTRLKEFSLREISLHAFMISLILNFTQNHRRVYMLNLIDRFLTIKNQITISMMNKIWERLTILQNNTVKENISTSSKQLIENFGYSHFRTSFMLSNKKFLSKLHDYTGK